VALHHPGVAAAGPPAASSGAIAPARPRPARLRAGLDGRDAHSPPGDDVLPWLPASPLHNIDAAEGVLGAIRTTRSGTPIDIILHTPGGLVLAASQIASALAEHDGPVGAIIPTMP
jgi:hypothetical protein